MYTGRLLAGWRSMGLAGFLGGWLTRGLAGFLGGWLTGCIPTWGSPQCILFVVFCPREDHEDITHVRVQDVFTQNVN